MAEALQTGIFEAEKLDDTTVQQLISLINAAYRRHSWLFPNDRLNKAQFYEETAGKEIVLLTDSLGKLVGGAMIYCEEDYLYLGLAAIELTQQSRGYGARLLQAIEEIAKQRQLARLMLISVEEIGNVDYYTRQGFRVIEREKQPAGTWGSLGPFTIATMEKRLQAE
jgi:N-acetylglutamate synthase-like GNAT family acetyltransferase